MGCHSFSSRSSWPRDRPRVSRCIAGGFFTDWAIREVWWACTHVSVGHLPRSGMAGSRVSVSSCHTVFQSGCAYICTPFSSVRWFSLVHILTNALMMVGEEASHHHLYLPPQLASREANPVPHLGVSSFSSPFSISRLPPADVNECGFKPRPCQHRCVNTHGSYKCFCLSGHMLLPNASCSSKFQQLACSQSIQRLDFWHLMLGTKLN